MKFDRYFVPLQAIRSS